MRSLGLNSWVEVVPFLGIGKARKRFRKSAAELWVSDVEDSLARVKIQEWVF